MSGKRRINLSQLKDGTAYYKNVNHVQTNAIVTLKLMTIFVYPRLNQTLFGQNVFLQSHTFVRD